MKKILTLLFALALLATPALAEETAPAPAPVAAPNALDEKPATEPRRYTPETQIIKDTEQQAGKDKAETAANIAAGDPPEVAELKMKAKSDVESQHALGVMYAEGEGGVERNYDEALKWHRMAALSGHPDSQHYLGFSYESGIGVTRNLVEAAQWYEKAASQGHAVSQGIIGNMYATGTGVDEDRYAAFIWLSVAKKNGDTYYEAVLADVTKRIPGRNMKSLNYAVRAWKPSAGEKTVDTSKLKLD